MWLAAQWGRRDATTAGSRGVTWLSQVRVVISDSSKNAAASVPTAAAARMLGCSTMPQHGAHQWLPQLAAAMCCESVPPERTRSGRRNPPPRSSFGRVKPSARAPARTPSAAWRPQSRGRTAPSCAAWRTAPAPAERSGSHQDSVINSGVSSLRLGRSLRLWVGAGLVGVEDKSRALNRSGCTTTCMCDCNASLCTQEVVRCG